MLFIRLGCILSVTCMFIIGATNSLKLMNTAKEQAVNKENDLSLPNKEYNLMRARRGDKSNLHKRSIQDEDDSSPPSEGMTIFPHLPRARREDDGKLYKRSIQNRDDSSMPSEEMTIFPPTRPPRGKRAVRRSKNNLPRLVSDLRRNKRSVNDTQESKAANRGDGVTEPVQSSVSEKETTSQTQKKSEESISTRENESSTEVSKKVDDKSKQQNATNQVYKNVFSLIEKHFFSIYKALQTTSQSLTGQLKSMFMGILDSLTRFSTQAFTVTRKLFLRPVSSSKSFVNSTASTNISRITV